ncbi:Endo-beta-1 [Phytophthora citrophthora]|uniref:Endo-beta-1 n=1 Tax=Phytophthora citrophthora TaxID=4793 RepID=A0AAD9H0Y4_9STRA|nr:Endo-beta-1 [Phytophthora citrophthora]
MLLSAPSDNASAYKIILTTTPLLESWEGWGTSLSWWANVFGDREDIADLFFTNMSSVSIDGAAKDIPALDFNIARYNIGGSGNNVIDDSGTEIAMKTAEYDLDIYPNFVVAYDNNTKGLVIVATNLGEAETITFDLLGRMDQSILGQLSPTRPQELCTSPPASTSSLAKVPDSQQIFQPSQSRH